MLTRSLWWSGRESSTGELYLAGMLVTLEHLGGERRGVEVLSLR